MEEKTVELMLLTQQCLGPTEPLRSEFRTQGVLRVRGDAWCVGYDEPGGSGMEGSHTELYLSPGGIRMLRSGSVTARLAFVPHQSTVSDYETPYGVLPLEVRTTDLTCRLGQRDAAAELRYELRQEGRLVSTNTLQILIREKETGEETL